MSCRSYYKNMNERLILRHGKIWFRTNLCDRNAICFKILFTVMKIRENRVSVLPQTAIFYQCIHNVLTLGSLKEQGKIIHFEKW